MQNRATFASVLAVIVPTVLVLIAVVALARPAEDALPTQSAPVPTSASTGQASLAAQPAVQLPTSAAPTAAPASTPCPSGPAAPALCSGKHGYPLPAVARGYSRRATQQRLLKQAGSGRHQSDHDRCSPFVWCFFAPQGEKHHTINIKYH
jgi:hypothetical protein